MTPWQPIYLRADDEEAMMEALDAAGLVDSDPETGDQIIGGDPHVIRLKPLPNLTEPSGKVIKDEEGNEYPEMVLIPKYHVNVLVHPKYEDDYIEMLKDVIINPDPKTPKIKYSN